MPQNDGALIIEDAVVRFLNFSGKEDTYNRAGDRNFCILLDQSLADQMLKDGWNVKTLKARADDPDASAHSSSSGFRSTTSTACRPIEPVAPSRAIRFIRTVCRNGRRGRRAAVAARPGL
jgi:hypothetical protein